MKKTLLSIAILAPVLFIGCQKTTGSETAENSERAVASENIATTTAVAPQTENYLLSPAEFKQKTSNGDVVIIDVRTAGELASLGYIKGAEHLDIKANDFKDKIAALDKDKEYYVYCHAGGRSASAKKIMDNLGFTKVYDLKGGISAWLAAGYEVVK